MRVLSGIQPTGEMHIGNYLGAVRNWVNLQEKEDCIFFIADLHALTGIYQSAEFPNMVLKKTIEILAAGIDPERSIIFPQSFVKEHTELCWILNTITPVAELERMTQYKEKSRKSSTNINAGLFDYPVLQAADILLYQTDAVPVGKDQVQHLELTKTIARKFNNKFGQTFKEPKALVLPAGAKIMSLTEPKKKMSKSDGPQNCLGLFDEPDVIQKKIMSATTDMGKTVKYDLIKKPGISNLLTIYSLFSGKTIKDIEKEFSDKGYAKFKKSLAELLITSLEPFRRKKKELENREVYVREIMSQGAKKAQVIAQATMQDVRKKIGLL
ncbi:MAG: tryptophan--tRNA ligase [Candidatus Parcubacteria bacterium]|nr:tryptophan--tRNA ligase [Candidatus Parcubacteria bacterium]